MFIIWRFHCNLISLNEVLNFSSQGVRVTCTITVDIFFADPLHKSSRPSVHSLCLAAQANVDILRMLLEHDKIKDQ